mmetsp:Transcript_14284/g.33760  ORF Transcript_14284/g.33760 Transcript_14284/m.33760 type:complete len:215 (+) Transcript_14284:877-1521(+)
MADIELGPVLIQQLGAVAVHAVVLELERVRRAAQALQRSRVEGLGTADARRAQGHGDARVVDEHLVHRRASELDEEGQGGGLAAAGHAAVDDRVAGHQTLVEERRHVLVPSELVHLCAQEDEVVRQDRVDREDDGAAQVEPRVGADAANGIAQLELLAARGQVAGRDALGADHLEGRVRHARRQLTMGEVAHAADDGIGHFRIGVGSRCEEESA